MVFHTTCATILRHIFGCDAGTLQQATDMCSIEKILGRPMGGSSAGRFRHVNYEIGEDEMNVEKYWVLKRGHMKFNWAQFKDDGCGWTFDRPDMYVLAPN